MTANFYRPSLRAAAYALIGMATFVANMPFTAFAQSSPDPWSTGFIKGVTWGWVGQRGEYEAPAAAESMRRLAATNAEWVCIAFATTMPTYDTAEFGWGDDNPQMVSDDEIRRAIRLARENGLKVILKPTINCSDGTWRAWIRFFRPVTAEERVAGVTGTDDPWGETPGRREGMVVDSEKWAAWWGNFSGFLIHYARIAEEQDVELFCLGCEMNSSESDGPRWRELIAAVRAEYGGLITYNANHGAERTLPWWDAVDVISISAYYEVPPAAGTTVEEAAATTTPKAEMLTRLQSVKADLNALSAEYKKPILFIETGVTNVRGGTRYPWSHPDAHLDSPLDEVEQADYYAALLETFWGEPWFMGFAWWDWPARLYDEDAAHADRGFCIYGKQAEAVLSTWYAKPNPALEVR